MVDDKHNYSTSIHHRIILTNRQNTETDRLNTDVHIRPYKPSVIAHGTMVAQGYRT